MQEVFVTAFSFRLLPDRFLFRPRFTLGGTESVAIRIIKKYTLKMFFYSLVSFRGLITFRGDFQQEFALFLNEFDAPEGGGAGTP